MRDSLSIHKQRLCSASRTLLCMHMVPHWFYVRLLTLNIIMSSVQSLKQIVNELSQVADAQSNTPSSQGAFAALANLVIGPNIPPLSPSPPLRSDSDIQQSRPPITVTPFWGPGLSAAATQPNPSLALHSPDAASRSQLTADAQAHAPPQPRRYSRDGNLPTSRDSSHNPSREGSTHGRSNLWQFSRNLSDDVLRSMFYKKLCWRLGAGSAPESLIAHALQASSTGVLHLLCTQW